MASNYTENFSLCQWGATDHVLRTDFNEDNRKIDAALEEMAGYGDTIAQHTTAIARLGNCQIYTSSYVGSGSAGTSNPNTLYFPKRPVVVMIFSSTMWFIGHPDSGLALITSSGGAHYSNICSRSGNSFRWYVNGTNPTQQMNTSGTTYYVTAFLDAAQ